MKTHEIFHRIKIFHEILILNSMENFIPWNGPWIFLWIFLFHGTLHEKFSWNFYFSMNRFTQIPWNFKLFMKLNPSIFFMEFTMKTL